MFEGSFYFKDLDEVKIELQELNGINFDTLEKCSQILDSLDGCYINNIERLKLQSLKLKYQKLKRADKIYKEINKDLGSDEAKFLSKNSKATLKELQNFLVDLGELWVFDIQNSLKMRKINLEKIKDILRSQKQIIYRHITSKDKQERKNLYKQFLKNESELHKTYSELGSNFLRQYNLDLRKHTANSMLNDFLWTIKLATTNLNTTFWIIVFLGSILCSFYFVGIKKVPQINLDEFMPLLIFASVVALSWLCCIVLLCMSSYYFLFKTNYKNNNATWVFKTSQIYFLVLLALPFIYEYDFDIIKFLLNHFSVFVGAYFVLIIGYFIYCIFNNSKSKFDDSMLIGIFFIADLLFILFVYEKYQDINIVLFLYVFFFFVFARLLSLWEIFEYKLILFITLIFAFFTTYFISPNLVNMINLANYEDDFTIKSEFVPKDILNLPSCFEGYGLTCIDDSLSGDKKTKINNLAMEVKSDDRYHFKAYIKSSFSLLKNKEGYLKKAIKNSCENNNSAPCYEQNATHITIKNYEKLFSETKKERENLFVRKFKIYKKNIEN